MELELPPQRDCLECLTPQTLELLKLGKIALGWGYSRIIFQTTICKDRKTDIMTTVLKIKNIL